MARRGALGEERDAEARRHMPLEPVDDRVEQQVERRVERLQRVDLRPKLFDEPRLIDDRVVRRELVDHAREPVIRADEQRLLRRHQPRNLRTPDDRRALPQVLRQRDVDEPLEQPHAREHDVQHRLPVEQEITRLVQQVREEPRGVRRELPRVEPLSGCQSLFPQTIPNWKRMKHEWFP